MAFSKIKAFPGGLTFWIDADRRRGVQLTGHAIGPTPKYVSRQTAAELMLKVYRGIQAASRKRHAELLKGTP